MIWLILLYVPMTAGGGAVFEKVPMESMEQCKAAGDAVTRAASWRDAANRKLFNYTCVEGGRG